MLTQSAPLARSVHPNWRTRLPFGASTEERFWAKVDKTDGCWNWIANKTDDGYGLFRLGRDRGSKTVVASRYSYELHHGAPPPDDVEVCHTCDNPGCVRPSHFFLGSHDDNMKDAARKQRIIPPRGEAHAHALLTMDQAREIRRRYALGGIKQVDLGAAFGVSQSVVSGVVRCETYREE